MTYRIENPCVGGSIPPRATKNFVHETPTHAGWRFCFRHAKQAHTDRTGSTESPKLPTARTWPIKSTTRPPQPIPEAAQLGPPAQRNRTPVRPCAPPLPAALSAKILAWPDTHSNAWQISMSKQSNSVNLFTIASCFVLIHKLFANRIVRSCGGARVLYRGNFPIPNPGYY